MPELAAIEFKLCVDPAGRQVTGQFEGLVREVQPLTFVFDTQGAAAGVHHHLTFGAAGGHIHQHVGVELALPLKVVGQPLRQAVEGELLKVQTQFWVGHQALIFSAQAGRPGHPALRTQGDTAIGQPLQTRRVLQHPTLAARLHVPAEQTPAPVVFVQPPLQRQPQLQHRPLQRQFQLLALEVTAAIGCQYAQLCVAGLNPAAFKVNSPVLIAIQRGIQRQVLQVIVSKGQLLTCECHLALRCLERTAYINPTFELTAQIRPQLTQTRQVQIQLRLELLLHTGAAVDAVIAQANVQSAQGEIFASALSLGLQDGGQAAQTAF